MRNISIEEKDITASGADANSSWFISNGILNISGAIPDYTQDNPAPWNQYAQDITYIDNNGITRVGDYAFSALENVTNDFIVDGSTLNEVGTHAFNDNIRVLSKSTNLIDSGNLYVAAFLTSPMPSVEFSSDSVTSGNMVYRQAGSKISLSSSSSLYYVKKYIITGLPDIIPEDGGNSEATLPRFSVNISASYDMPEKVSGVYQITNKYQLSYAAYHYYSSNDSWAITDDFDLSEYANFSGYSMTMAATIDGQGHTIKINLNTSSQNTALFKQTANGFNLHDLNVTGNIVTTDKFAGGIVGAVNGSNNTMERCTSDVNIKFTPGGDATAGGLAGIINTNAALNVKNCYYTGKIYTDDSKSIEGVGGLCGWNSGTATFTNCFTVGTYANVTGGDNICRGSGYSLTNCYCLNTMGTSTQGVAKTATEFENGTVTSLLGSSFVQGDAYPVLAGGLVTLSATYSNGTCNVSIDNKTNAAAKGTIYVATYDQSGTLMNIVTKQISVAKIVSFTNTAIFTDTVNITKNENETLKVMFWNDKYVPISNVVEL